MRFSCGRVAFFLIFGVCKIRARFGGVLGGSGGGFLRHFGPDLVDFEGSERSQISSSKLEAEKVISETRKGSRSRTQAALLLIVDQSIIDIIDR